MGKTGNGMLWYWDRYMADAALSMCSLAAQGLWARMLGYCAMSEDRGYLLVAGKRVDVAMLAVLVGRPLEEVAPLIEELEINRVFSRTRGGVVYNRGMVKDETKKRVAQENGKKGGNPSLSRARGNSQSDNLDDKPRGLKKVVNPPIQSNPTHKENLPPASVSETANLGGGFLKGQNSHLHPDYASVVAVLEGIINSPSITVWGLVQEWLAAGTTKDEIVATVNSVTRRQRADDPSWQPGSLKYFSPAIERARIARIAGKPPAATARPVRSVHEGGPRTQRMWSHAERADWMKAHGFELMFSAHPTVQAKLREEGVLEHWPTPREV